MPKMGEIKTAKELGYKGGHKRIWVPCIDCGKCRWVLILCGQPHRLRCPSCSKKGMKNSGWKGGIRKDASGYISISMPEHPFADSGGRIQRARLILENKLGRYLLEGCVPHHRNEIKDDDRPENLEEMLDGNHRRLHSRLSFERRHHAIAG